MNYLEYLERLHKFQCLAFNDFHTANLRFENAKHIANDGIWFMINLMDSSKQLYTKKGPKEG